MRRLDVQLRGRWGHGRPFGELIVDVEMPNAGQPPPGTSSAAASSGLGFNPTALLNPVGMDRQMATNTFTNGHDASNAAHDGVEYAAMIERNNRVAHREAPAKRRKVITVEDDDITVDAHKNHRFDVNTASNGGIIGGYMRMEREKAARDARPGRQSVDLTNEGPVGDGGDDDEIVVTGSRRLREDLDQVVCLGSLRCIANVDHIPWYPKIHPNASDRGSWPLTRVVAERDPGNNHVFMLKDRGPVPTRFGTIELKCAKVLRQLMCGSDVSGFRFKAFLERATRYAEEEPRSPVSRAIGLTVTLYAKKPALKGIGTVLTQHGLFLTAPVKVDDNVEYLNPHVPVSLRHKGAGASGRPQPQTYDVVRTQEEMIRATNDMFDNMPNSENLPETEPDRTIIETALQPHQKQALHFLLEHERDQEAEHGGSVFSLWKPQMVKGRRVWQNVITSQQMAEKPTPVRGGILADMMGLGKTLSILSLLASTLGHAREFGDEPVAINEELHAQATLVVCPKSVLANWEEQIRAHVAPRKFQTYAYHGANRTQDLEELAKTDVVLTSYNTVASEFGQRLSKRKALCSIKWFRIVLDEAHSIRNLDTQVSKACCALSAQRRWAVTGTPVQNRLEDLGALIKFLRIQPFDQSANWSRFIMAPLKTGNELVYQHLRLLVDSITLRRLKDRIGLPEKKEYRVLLDFSPQESIMYQHMAGNMNLEITRMSNNEHGRLRGRSYAHVLRSISRLRAICAHGKEMLSEDDLKELEGSSADMAIDLGDEPELDDEHTFITENKAYEWLNLMSDSEQDQCESCSRKLWDAGAADADPASDSDELDSETGSANDLVGYLSRCYHLFCTACKAKEEQNTQLSRDRCYTCRYCQSNVRAGFFELRRSKMDLFLDAKANKNRKGTSRWDDSTYSGPSTKVQALLQALQRNAAQSQLLPPDEPPIRSVVFSGWTTYLDLIGHALARHAIPFVRLDGSMSVKARSAVLAAFACDPRVTVLLVSIKAGGQGLNFTAANKVYMMEPQFNPGVEAQAVDRVHRIGQTRPVEIVRYLVRASIEEYVVKLQERKEKLARMSLEQGKGKMGPGMNVQELMELFQAAGGGKR